MNHMTRVVAAGVIVVSSLATHSIESQRGAADNDRRAIDSAYAAWASAANAKDMARWLPFLAPDALFLPPNHAALRSHQAIRDFYAALFADRLFTIKCKQEKVEVAASGDLAWSTGRCEVTFTGPGGSEGRDSSKWVKVWKKQPDGKWKCAVNSWSSELSAPPR